jgi:hypothetical protein
MKKGTKKHPNDDLLRETPPSYELKKEKRFRVEFPEDWNLPSWLVHSCDSPSLKLVSGAFNSEYKWQPITITFVDPIGPSSSLRLFDLAHANKFENGMFNIVLLDPNLNEVSRWSVEIDKVIEIGFGSHLEHGSDGFSLPFIRIVPTKCTMLY